MRLSGRGERLLDAHVQLLAAGPEPAAASGSERLGLLELLERRAGRRRTHVLRPRSHAGPRPGHGRSRGSSQAHGLPSSGGRRARRHADHRLYAARSRRAAPSNRRGAPNARRRPRRAVRADRASVRIAIALVVLVTSGRPVLYRGERVGRRGRFFHMLKFRTMRSGAEDRIGQHLGAELVAATRRGADASRRLAEAVAARRDPAALERAARRHVVRRPTADPSEVLLRARAGPTGVLAAARRAPRPDRIRPGAPRLRDVDGREARP